MHVLIPSCVLGLYSPTKNFMGICLCSPPIGIALLVSFLSVFLVLGQDLKRLDRDAIGISLRTKKKVRKGHQIQFQRGN